MTLNKSLRDLGIPEESNCINAAFSFHSRQPIFKPYSTMDFLEAIRSQYWQLESKNQLLVGDLVVFWSRVSDDWADRNILVKDLSPNSPGFPFGIVFDHVAVFVGQNNLYHKPDPTRESRFQINTWDDVVEFNQFIDGFELTFHRKIP